MHVKLPPSASASPSKVSLARSGARAQGAHATRHAQPAVPEDYVFEAVDRSPLIVRIFTAPAHRRSRLCASAAPAPAALTRRCRCCRRRLQ